MKAPIYFTIWTYPVVLLALGCGSDAGVTNPIARVDGVRPSLASERYSPWSSPVNLGSVNSLFSDQHPALSKDGLTLYFASNRPDGLDLNIWVAHRECAECSWSEPVVLESLKSPYLDAAPTLSRDEHQLFFASQRPNGHCSNAPCDRDLWVSYREEVDNDFGWQEAVNLGDGPARVNSANQEVAPSYFENDDDGLPQLFFNDGALNTNGVLAGGDIYVSQLAPDGTWGAPALVPGINSPTTDQRPSISRDGRELYFFSTRGPSIARLWVATRESVHHPWNTPVLVPLGDNVQTTQPFIHSDATTETLLFVRQVPVPGTDPIVTHNDLFMSQRTRLENSQ